MRTTTATDRTGIKTDRTNGMTITAIAKKYRFSQRTIAKVLGATTRTTAPKTTTRTTRTTNGTTRTTRTSTVKTTWTTEDGTTFDLTLPHASAVKALAAALTA